MQFTLFKKTLIEIPTKLIGFRWCGKGGILGKLKCSRCKTEIGSKLFGIAMMIEEEDGKQRSLRLCEGCGKLAEAVLGTVEDPYRVK